MRLFSRPDHTGVLPHCTWVGYRSMTLTATACTQSLESTRKLPVLSCARYWPKRLLVAQAKLVVGAQAVTGCQSTKHVMQAYRKLAKSRHPDRGGSAAEFSKLQQAFEVLADPKQREVYDAWARQTQFRYVPGVDAQVSTWPSTCYHMHSATAGSIPCKSVPKLAIYMYSHRAEKTFSWTSMRGLGFTATHKHSLL